MRYFVAAFEEGSLQKAAQRLNVAQPALSRRVRDLEAELGCQLLERGPRGVTPTRAGLALYRDAIAMLDSLSETLQNARHLGLEQDRDIRIGFAQAASRKYKFVQQVLMNFSQRNPQSGIAYTPGSSVRLAQDLRSGELDIADQINPLSPPLRRHGIEPVISHLTDDTWEQLDLVTAGAGICLMPASTMLIVPEGQLIFRAVPDLSMTLDFRLAWQDDPSSADTKALLEMFHCAIDDHQAQIAAGEASWAMLDSVPVLGLP